MDFFFAWCIWRDTPTRVSSAGKKKVGRNSFSCVLIGSDSLLSECGRVLLGRGHEIVGVVSDAPKILGWARATGLRAFTKDEDFDQTVGGLSFDYLFSIANLSLVPEAVLKMARRGAINFHDGPLPRYAGVNAPAWALINGESTYGITWHEMTAGADEGPVYKQALFDIGPNETSLSLNLRCFERGVSSFAELCDELAEGSAQSRAARPHEALLLCQARAARSGVCAGLAPDGA